MIFVKLGLFFFLPFLCVGFCGEPGLFPLDEEFVRDSSTCTATGSSGSGELQFLGLSLIANPITVGTQTERFPNSLEVITGRLITNAVQPASAKNDVVITPKNNRLRGEPGNESFSSNGTGSVPSVFGASFDRKPEEALFPMED